jgi:CRP-like cAMP-binding protein
VSAHKPAVEKDILAPSAKPGRHVPVSRARIAQTQKKTERSALTEVHNEEEISEPALVPLRQLIVAKSSASFGFGQDNLEGAAALTQEQLKAVADLPLLKGLDSSVRETLMQRGTVQTLSEGELLFREGEPCKAVMALVKGTAKLFFTAGNGRIAHTRWLFAPASVGTSEALANAPHATAVSLLEKSTVWSIGAEDFRRIASGSPRLIENVLAETSTELRESMALARALLFDDTQARLAQLFVSLLDKRGLPGREGRMIPLALTQQDFAEALGVDLRSINRVMVDWFATGLVVKSEKRFCVKELDKLEAIAFASKAK